MESSNNQGPVTPESPSLSDVLALEASIETALKEAVIHSDFIRDISPSERIALNHYPEGKPHSEGREISHICLTQKTPSGSYDTVMNYIIMRDSDETTTRIIKRPPFNIPSFEETYQGFDPGSYEGRIAGEKALEQVEQNSEKYKEGMAMGLYDVTVDEVRQLTQQIETIF